MTAPPHRPDAPVPERRRLETSFIRARWLAAVAIVILTLLGGFSPAVTATASLVLVAGNGAIRYLNSRMETLTGQRRLGVAAVMLDTAVVLGLAMAAPAGAAIAAKAALFVVVAETAMRFAPGKALGGALALVAGLALVMVLRSRIASGTFDLTLLIAIGVLVLLVGTMIGSVVREIYRQGVAVSIPLTPSKPPLASLQTDALPEEALALLTPRERQVMTLIAQGYSNPQIAAALVVEQKTVKNHINNIYSKLRLNSRYEAISHMLGQRQAGEGLIPKQNGQNGTG